MTKEGSLERRTSLAMALALYPLYFAFLYASGAGGLLLPSGVLAGSVFSLEAVKLLLVVAVPRLRVASWQSLYIFETIEIILLPPAYGILLALHVPSAGGLVFRFVVIYFATQLILFPPFSIYRLTRSMSQGEGAGGVLVSAVLHFGLVSYALELVSSYRSEVAGIEGLGTLMVSTTGGNALPAGSSTADFLIAFAGVIFYISAMTYSVTDPRGQGLPFRAIALASLATLASAALILVFSFVGSLSVYLTSGSFAMMAAVWWIARG